MSLEFLAIHAQAKNASAREKSLQLFSEKASWSGIFLNWVLKNVYVFTRNIHHSSFSPKSQ
jgi:hypothetical protein